MPAVDDPASTMVDPEYSVDVERAGCQSPALSTPEDDPLSDVLRTVRLTGAVFFLWDVARPFASPVPRGDRFARALLPGAQQIASYHVVVAGQCWGSLVGEHEPVRLEAGDVLFVPRGDAYVMADSEDGCRAGAIDETAALAFFRALAAGELPFLIREGEGEQRAEVVCGFLGCDTQPFNPIVAALPGLLRLRCRGRGESADRLRALVDYAVAEARRPTAGSRGVLVRLGELIFVEVLRQCVEGLGDRLPGGWLGGLRDPIVGRCLGLMHRRPAAPWTLASLALAVGSSRSGLAQRFAERVGMPPIRYLTSWRLQLAAALLRDSSRTITAIAHEVGYGSAPAFSRAFTRLVGRTPHQWREQSRLASQDPGDRPATGQRQLGQPTASDQRDTPPLSKPSAKRAP